MREIDPVRIFCRHFRQVVEPARTQRTGAEGYAVVSVRNGGKQLIVTFLPRYDAREPEHIPGGIVGVDGHIDSGLVAGGHDAVQKIYEIFKQLFVRDPLIFFQKPVEFFGRITLVPAGKAQVFRVEFQQRFVTIAKGVRPVRVFALQIRPQPVENGHKIVAHAFDAYLTKIADGLRVIFDQPVPGRFAEFDVFVYGHRFDHFHRKIRAVAQFFQPFDFGKFPDFSHRNVVNGGHHARHVRDLPDVFQRDRIFFSVPTESHFHSSLLL